LFVKDKWELTNGEKDAVLKMVNENKQNHWESFKQQFKEQDKFALKSVEDAFDVVEKGSGTLEDFHFALLTLHQFYPVGRKEYIDGIVLRNIERRAEKKGGNHKIDYVIAELLIKEEGPYDLFPPAKTKLYQLNNPSPVETKFSSQEGEIDADTEEELSKPDEKEMNAFFWRYFLPCFADYPDFKFTKFYPLEEKKEVFSKFKHILIIPMYDAYIDGEYYGNFFGNLQIPFGGRENLHAFIGKGGHKSLIEHSHLLIREIKQSATHEILQQPIEHGIDFLEHFVKYCCMLQDWESVTVFKKNKLLYCYKRDNEGRWVKSNSPESYSNSNAGELFLNDLFDTKFIPSLYEEDIYAYRDYQLKFEYPLYTVFPKDKERLWVFYKRELIELLRQLALQRRVRVEILRHGMRAAIAGIMSRNMTHNIGSHILFYSKKIKEEFKNYLEERMDFIAEITTSEPAWMLPLGLVSDVLQNFVKQDYIREKIGKSEGIKNIKVHYHILNENTRKYQQFEIRPDGGENIPEKRVSIVSGMVGRQAIYSILENVIRNSAKHRGINDGADNSMELHIRLDEEGYPECNEWIKVRVWDNLSHEDSLQKIIPYVTEAVINDDGTPLPTGWGIKEMRICASFLRKRPLWEIRSKPHDREKVLRAICVNEEGEEQNSNDKGYLCYEFCLPKPKELLIIGCEAYKKLKNKARLKTYGIDVEQSIDRFLPVKENIPHELLILEDLKVLRKVENEREKWPSKIFVIIENNQSINSKREVVFWSKDKYQKLIDKLKNLDMLALALLWESWVLNFFNISNSDEIPNLVINLARNKNDSISSYPLPSTSINVEIYFDGNSSSKFSPSRKKFVLYDNHGWVNCQWINCQERKNKKRGKQIKDHDNCIYYEKGKIKSSLWSFLRRPLKEDFWVHKLIFNLMETALTKVLIIDERIFNYITESEGTSELKETLKKMNIYILENFSYAQPSEEDKEKILEEVSNYDALIIHQGILDKMIGEKKIQIENFIKCIKQKVPFVIVTSGRGIPPTLPENARFLPISPILSFICTQIPPNKFYLIQSILAARRRGI